MEPELLTTNAANYSASKYPKAIRLLEYIRDTCNMGTGTLPGNVVSGVNRFMELRNYDISLEWIGIDRFDVMDEIDAGRPCMISTMPGTVESSLELHTMTIYGYQEYSNTYVIGWLVHTGHYTDVIQNSSGTYYMPLRWINPALGSCQLFRFVSDTEW